MRTITVIFQLYSGQVAPVPPIYSIHRRNLGILHHHRIPFPACIRPSKSSRTARRSTQKILALRQQVAVLKRKRPRPLLRKADRVFWVILSYLWPGWRHALVIVRPETVIGWAPQGVQAFLDMAVAAGKTGPTAGVEGDPLSGPTDVAGEHTVGRTSDPWRAFEAWLFHLPGRRLEIHRPLPIAAIAVVADIPYKSRRLPGVDRFLRGPHGHVPPPVRVHRAPPRAPPDRAFRCNGEPDDGVGRTADPRGIPMGHGAAVPDPRPGRRAHTGNRSARP